MATLANVKALFDASSALKAKDDINKLRDASPEAASAMGALESAVSALSNPLVLMGGALLAGVSAMVALGFSAIETADSLGKLSLGTGKTITELQVLEQIADKSGSSLDGLLTGLDFISRGMSRGEEETQKYAKALAYFDVSMTDVNGKMKDAETIANEVAVAFTKTKDSASTQAAAADALGKQYKTLIPTYLDLNKKQEEQNFLMQVGALATDEQVRASTEYNDTMSDVHKVLQGLGNYAAQTFLPLLNGLASTLKESSTNGGLLEATINILKAAFTGLTYIAKGVFAVLIGIDTMFTVLGKSLGGFVAILDRLLARDVKGAKQVFTEMAADIDKAFLSGGERINKMFADTEQGAKKAEEAVKKLDRGTYRSTNEKKVPDIKLKVEKDPIDEANKALQGLIDGLITSNKQVETGSTLQQMAARIEQDRYSIGSQMLKDRVLALASENDQLKANKELTKELKDLQKGNDDVVRGLDDEIARRTMNSAEFRKMTLLRQLDLSVQEKLEAVNQNVAGWEQRRAAIQEQYLKNKEALIAATERQSAAEQSWQVGATQALQTYKDEVNDVASATNKALTSAFSGAEDALVKFVTTGKLAFGDLAASIAADLARMAIRAMIVKPLLAFFGFADGAAFSAGATTPFAQGDVVSSATTFPMANGGTGMMGEAGPEAIMPLTRMPNGKLGVAADGGGSGGGGSVMNVGGIVVNVQGGSSGKEKDDAHLADLIGRSIDQRLRATVNEEGRNQRRPGNSLNPTRMTGVF